MSAPGGERVRRIGLANGAEIWLTERELGAVGYRELSNDAGQRIGQFGLCRDSQGDWVYPPLREAEETVDQMLERNREARRRMGLCAKPTEGRYRGFAD